MKSADSDGGVVGTMAASAAADDREVNGARGCTETRLRMYS